MVKYVLMQYNYQVYFVFVDSLSDIIAIVLKPYYIGTKISHRQEWGVGKGV